MDDTGRLRPTGAGADKPLAMRVLVANEGIAEAGGVDTYLTAVLRELGRRGHPTAFLHYNRRVDTPGAWPAGLSDLTVGVLDEGLESALASVGRWRPDVCFSHNMRPLDVERALLDRWPVVKMMHGYFGTCIGGQKSFAWPRREPCGRRFGAACVALYLPRGCGQRRVTKMWEQLRWAHAQRRLFPRYAATVAASEHMRREYVRNGLPAETTHALPLFTPVAIEPADDVRCPSEPMVLFVGRMTHLKGGDLLVRSVATLTGRSDDRPLRLVMAGDGPQRTAWTRLARERGVAAEFPGWVGASTRRRLLAEATVLAVPSVWPEPFGLVGLEAAAAGVPAVAFDVGGIRDWLEPERTGYLAPGHPPTVAGLSAALERALDPESQQRLRPAARQRAAERSLSAYVDSLEPVLESARRQTAPSR